MQEVNSQPWRQAADQASGEPQALAPSLPSDKEAEATGYWPAVQTGRQPGAEPRHLDSEFLTRPDWWEADFKGMWG